MRLAIALLLAVLVGGLVGYGIGAGAREDYGAQFRLIEDTLDSLAEAGRVGCVDDSLRDAQAIKLAVADLNRTGSRVLVVSGECAAPLDLRDLKARHDFHIQGGVWDRAKFADKNSALVLMPGALEDIKPVATPNAAGRGERSWDEP